MWYWRQPSGALKKRTEKIYQVVFQLSTLQITILVYLVDLIFFLGSWTLTSGPKYGLQKAGCITDPYFQNKNSRCRLIGCRYSLCPHSHRENLLSLQGSYLHCRNKWSPACPLFYSVLYRAIEFLTFQDYICLDFKFFHKRHIGTYILIDIS